MKDILYSIESIIYDNEEYFFKYTFMGFEFENLSEIRSYKAGNPSGLSNGILVKVLVIKVIHLVSKKEFEIGISLEKGWVNDNDTSLLVYVNNRDTPTIEYNINKNFEGSEDSRIQCYHHARIVVKHSVQTKHVIDYINKKEEKLVSGNRVFLGNISIKEDGIYSFENFQQFISKLIIYTIYLEEFKSSWREVLNGKRIPISDNLKIKILNRDGFVCRNSKCRSIENLEIDHIIPVSWFIRQGKNPKEANVESNLQVLCKKCNLKKSDNHNTRY
ncbi:MAG: HNH endonuclease [Leptospiraceae bacterium]|nr:HNH endonuclease [Leptospiraceae bacterium]